MNGPTGGRRGRPPRTLRVRMLTTVGDVSGTIYEAGEEYDLPFQLAQDYLSNPKDFPRAEAVARRSVDAAETRG